MPLAHEYDVACTIDVIFVGQYANAGLPFIGLCYVKVRCR